MDSSLACRLNAVREDREILELVEEAQPAVVTIDAPLSLPEGRLRLGDRSGPHFRACDLELRARGIPFFPLTLGPMRMLTRRGMRLAERLGRSGILTFETYPGAAQDLMGMPRKNAGRLKLRRALKGLGVSGDIARRGLTHDELDAATAALVGVLYLHGDAEAIGRPEEGVMLLPRLGFDARSPRALRNGPDL